MIKVAIVGSRNFNNLNLVEEYVNNLPESSVVVSGGAIGVDTAAVDAAKKRGLKTVVFLPQWEKYGKIAGILRNTRIVDFSDRLVAFWDGKSTGTMDSIMKAKKRGIPVEIVYG